MAARKERGRRRKPVKLSAKQIADLIKHHLRVSAVRVGNPNGYVITMSVDFYCPRPPCPLYSGRAFRTGGERGTG